MTIIRDPRDIMWECGECGMGVRQADRHLHARTKHKKDASDLIWLCLENVKIFICEWCHLPYTKLPGRRGHVRNWKERKIMTAIEKENAEGAYWVDWSDPAKPVIRIYDESAPEGTQWLTLLEARDEILRTVREALRHWHEVGREAMHTTAEELEKR